MTTVTREGLEAVRSTWTTVNEKVADLERQLVWTLEAGTNAVIDSNEMNVLLTAIETELTEARRS